MRAELVIDRLTPGDIPAAMAIQTLAHSPELVEPPEVLANRAQLPSSCSLAAWHDDEMVGYLIAHGWAADTPPPLGRLVEPAAEDEVLFLHDLAVAPAGRGLRIGGLLVEQATTLAVQAGLCRAQLIAVASAAPYWQGLGFAAQPVSPAMREKLALYGSNAVWMGRDLPG